MHSFLSKEMAELRIRDLREQAEARVTVRVDEPGDREALRLLAALDSQRLPSGPTLVAEVNHELVAALPLNGGKALADPFKPTAHLVAMLKLRARQLRAA